MDFLHQACGDIVIDVFEPQAQGNLLGHPQKKHRISKKNGVTQLIEDLDFVYPIAHTSSQRASLFISEDSDAVI